MSRLDTVLENILSDYDNSMNRRKYWTKDGKDFQKELLTKEQIFNLTFKWHQPLFDLFRKEKGEEWYNKSFVCWDCISVAKNSDISEDFLREYANKVNWKLLVRYRKLSEDFIMEFKDKLDLKRVLMYQNLSEDFKEKVIKLAREKGDI